MKLSQMVRAALQVSDLEKSKVFYSEVLGLSEVYAEGTAKGGNMHEFIGMPDGVTTRVCVMKQPDFTAYGMVGLFEVTNPTPPKIERPSEGCNMGEICMVFYCSDLDEVICRAESHAHTIVCEPKPIRVRGYVKQREMALRGPDGEKINLIEWDPDEAANTGHRPETWKGEPE
jgi:catechol 2,3-dioxygenase-like lactoylglutathione lyase family enzyme